MSTQQATIHNSNTDRKVFFLAGKPTAPMDARIQQLDKRRNDPSASQPFGRSYPIPSFFNYRAKPKDYDYI